MKKLSIIFIALSLIFSSTVFAADVPPCSIDNGEAFPYSNVKPTNAISLPNESGSFSYSFADYKIQYSDFGIYIDTFSPINMSITGTSEEHDVLVEIYKAGTSKSPIFSTPVTVNENIEQSFSAFFNVAVGGHYYIKITSETKNGASGVFKVWGGNF